MTSFLFYSDCLINIANNVGELIVQNLFSDQAYTPFRW